jgi:ribonuclease BN (tRNA processing enzyme)
MLSSTRAMAFALPFSLAASGTDPAQVPPISTDVRIADSTTIVLLGTGTPRPDPLAFGPATAIVVGERVFLFDAGAGVMRRFSAAKLPITGPTAVFFTHLHSDHTLGYPDLILTTWVVGRAKPLRAYGPHGLARMTNAIIDAWHDDIDIRTNGLEHGTPNGYAVDVHEVSPGIVFDSGGVKITAIPVLHGSWKEAYGYRIDTPTRSIVISGDTRPSPALERATRNVDVLIHEVHPDTGLAPPAGQSAREWDLYLKAFHTSASELGALAASAQPRLLILYHFTASATRGEEVTEAIRKQGYAGRIVVGKDLERY